MCHVKQWYLLTALNSTFIFSFNQQKPLYKNNFADILKAC